jgi:coatomer protein complex subunit epsilon
MSELFDLKTFFLLGQYQAAINEGGKVKPRDEFAKIERDIFVYRAFIEQGNFQVVLDGLTGDNVPPPLQAVRALAGFLGGRTSRDDSLALADGWLTDPDFAQDPMVLLILSILYERAESLQKALQCVFSNKLLEAYVPTSIRLPTLSVMTYGSTELWALQQQEMLTSLQIIPDYCPGNVTQARICHPNLAQAS